MYFESNGATGSKVMHGRDIMSKNNNVRVQP